MKVAHLTRISPVGRHAVALINAQSMSDSFPRPGERLSARNKAEGLFSGCLSEMKGEQGCKPYIQEQRDCMAQSEDSA